jgi:membrane-associated phospholipid phosphatase
MHQEVKKTTGSLLAGLAFAMVSLTGYAQRPDTLISKLDSLKKQSDTTGKQINNTEKSAFNENTVITLPAYFILLGSDMKQAFTKPFHMKGDWGNALKFILLETALSFADKPIQRNALDFRNNNASVRGISDYVTRFGGMYEIYTLTALGSYGFIFKSQKLKTTTLLATQAYLTGGAFGSVFKTLSGRQRPYYVNENSVEASPTFHGPFYKSTDAAGNKINSSFPSGHTTVAFAAATVFAMEYKNKRLVPIISYSVATLIGLSRITENKHWLTDVVAGAALGFLTGQQVVNNYHRYARIKNGEAAAAAEKKKNTISFQLDYSTGQVLPGLVYKFN